MRKGIKVGINAAELRSIGRYEEWIMLYQAVSKIQGIPMSRYGASTAYWRVRGTNSIYHVNHVNEHH